MGEQPVPRLYVAVVLHTAYGGFLMHCISWDYCILQPATDEQAEVHN